MAVENRMGWPGISADTSAQSGRVALILLFLSLPLSYNVPLNLLQPAASLLYSCIRKPNIFRLTNAIRSSAIGWKTKLEKDGRQTRITCARAKLIHYLF